MAGPSIDSSSPAQSFTSIFDPRKLQARGAAERESFSELRHFLDANPLRPEDRVLAYEPKSHFEWDGSDGGGSEPKVGTSNMRFVQRLRRKQAAADMEECEDSESDPLSQVDSWMQAAADHAQRRYSQVGHPARGGANDAEVEVSERYFSSNSSRSAARRTSVMNLFNNPMWNDDEREYGSSETNGHTLIALHLRYSTHCACRR